MQNLVVVDLFGYSDDFLLAALELFAELWLAVGLFLEHECREESDNLLGLESRRRLAKDVLDRMSFHATHDARTFSRISSVSTNSSAE